MAAGLIDYAELNKWTAGVESYRTPLLYTLALADYRKKNRNFRKPVGRPWLARCHCGVANVTCFATGVSRDPRAPRAKLQCIHLNNGGPYCSTLLAT